ncbi:hypothetical protein QZH41_017398 [Actinostola sp. cb2023]|nr:hypothetical protein QZH41_017398 [Actinostola sp. cb2023]
MHLIKRKLLATDSSQVTLRTGGTCFNVYVREAGIHFEIVPEDGLAMKSELEIAWNKIRHMRRYYAKDS